MIPLRTAAVAGWLAAACALPAFGQTASSAETLSAARQALAQNRPEEARTAAGQLLAANPADRDAALVMVPALEALGRHADAITFYDTFVARTRRQDPTLLAPIATAELRAIAERAGVDVRLRTEALERLARTADPAALRELRSVAEAGGTGAAILADVALVRLGDQAAVSRLASAGELLPDKSVLADAILRAGARNQTSLLMELLSDQNPVTRAAAADALGALDGKAAIPTLRNLLTDEVPRVRARAALALKKLGDSAGDELVASMLKSPVNAVRLAALEANRAPRDGNRLNAAKEILKDPDPLNRIRAAEVAAQDDPATARAVLVTVVNDPDLTARREACRVLESLPPYDVGLFRRLLGDPQDGVRVPAAGGILNAAKQPPASPVR